MDWIILRTGSQSTIALAAALTHAGHHAWTPVEHRRRRMPRSRSSETIAIPILPSFVFARAESLAALQDMARSPDQCWLRWTGGRMQSRGRPYFRIFRHDGKIPVIADSALDPLRAAEQRTAPRKPARALKPGEAIRMTEGGFAGLTGLVEAVRGRWAWVAVPGFDKPLRIAAWLLDEIPQSGLHSTPAQAA